MGKIWIKQLQTFFYMSFGGHIFLFLWDKYLEVELLSPRLDLDLVRIIKFFSKIAVSIYTFISIV